MPRTERIAHLVHSVRGERVLFDADLAMLYGVPTKVLNQAVKRNLERFPEDFMFRITPQEWRTIQSGSLSVSQGQDNWSQIVTSSSKHRGAIYVPYAFTEQGVAMLSSVLKGRRAASVNVEIMRAFVRLRQMIAQNRELARRMDALEAKYDHQFKVVFDAIRELMAPAPVPKRRIGFVSQD